MFELLLHLACKTVHNRQKQNTDMENNKEQFYIEDL